MAKTWHFLSNARNRHCNKAQGSAVRGKQNFSILQTTVIAVIIVMLAQ